jgi:uncharacterized protein YdhG (YjbR/CyaY superfamily)
VQEDVATYLEAVDPERRPLFDRVHRLVLEVRPDAELVLSYKMPTFVAGEQQLHVGVWKHGLSFYGWQHGRDGGLAARHPHLDNGRGTLRLPLAEAAGISDDELRDFLAAVLTEPAGQTNRTDPGDPADPALTPDP